MHMLGLLFQGTISQYFGTLNCPVCGEMTQQIICANCRKDPQKICVVLGANMQKSERIHSQFSQVCFSCMGRQDRDLPCQSLDCPVLYRLTRATRELAENPHMRAIQAKIMNF